MSKKFKSKIYTKRGDQGETSLVSGTTVSKSNLRVEAYGTIDELNSFVGLLASSLSSYAAPFDTVSSSLQQIQNQLFVMGSRLACEIKFHEKHKLKRISEQNILDLEEQIDFLDSALPPLSNFILPAGTNSSCLSHVCRTICRRAERLLIRFGEEISEERDEINLIFINRLSDYFFVLARFLN